MKMYNKKKIFLSSILGILYFSVLIPLGLSESPYGTFNFDGETGKSGTNISFVDVDATGGSCTASVVASLGDFEEVLQLNDTSGLCQADIRHNFSAPQETGSIQLYFRSSNVNKGCYIRIAGDIDNYDDGIRILIRFNNLTIIQYGLPDINKHIQNDKWYKLFIEWDCSNQVWGVYIDDDQLRTDLQYSYGSFPSEMKGIRFDTVGEDSGYQYFFDAICVSWDPNCVPPEEFPWFIISHSKLVCRTGNHYCNMQCMNCRRAKNFLLFINM